MANVDLETACFMALAAVVACSALGVALSRNLVRAAVWLLFTLVGVSLLYFLLAAPFLGAAQLMIYVGGTLVLVVFGVMLTAQQPLLPQSATPFGYALAAVASLLLFGLLVVASLGIVPPSAGESAAAPLAVGELGLHLLNVPDTASSKVLPNQPGAYPPTRRALGYLLPFEVLSIHLLVVLIAAAYLARARRNRGEIRPPLVKE